MYNSITDRIYSTQHIQYISPYLTLQHPPHATATHQVVSSHIFVSLRTRWSGRRIRHCGIIDLRNIVNLTTKRPYAINIKRVRIILQRIGVEDHQVGSLLYLDGASVRNSVSFGSIPRSRIESLCR
jgi:hypothetical protein